MCPGLDTEYGDNFDTCIRMPKHVFIYPILYIILKRISLLAKAFNTIPQKRCADARSYKLPFIVLYVSTRVNRSKCLHDTQNRP